MSQKAEEGWIEWGRGERPIKDARTIAMVRTLYNCVVDNGWDQDEFWHDEVLAYRIIEAHGADAEPARPTPFPCDYSELVWDADGWSQTIIVDGKRPEWLRDDDECSLFCRSTTPFKAGRIHKSDDYLAIRVRCREPKRETVTGLLSCQGNFWRVSYDLIDGKPDLSTLKIAEDAL